MDRKNGIDIRGDTMRISFYYEGVRYRPMLKVGDSPMRPTPPNQKYARRLVQEIRNKIQAGNFLIGEYFPEFGNAGSTNVNQQLDTWLTTQRIETSTKKGYESAARFWKKQIGTTELRQLKLSQIKTVIAARPDLSGKTINNYVSVLRDALELAVADRLLPENPALKVPRAKKQKVLPDPFDAAERDQIIGQFREKHPGQISNLVQFWFWTGLRTSEIFGLRWPNVDLNKSEVLIAEAVVRGEYKDRTKTNVVRTIKLNSLALAALRSQQEHTRITGQYVFHDPRYGLPWTDERAFRRSYWTPVLKLLGIRYRRPYQMRHSYATALLMAGVKPGWAAKQLGHSTEMFFRTYAKWIDGQASDHELARLEQTLVIVPAA